MNDIDRLVEAVDKLTEEIKRLREQPPLYPPYYSIPSVPVYAPQYIPVPITCNVYGLSPPTTHYTHG